MPTKTTTSTATVMAAETTIRQALRRGGAATSRPGALPTGSPYRPADIRRIIPGGGCLVIPHSGRSGGPNPGSLPGPLAGDDPGDRLDDLEQRPLQGAGEAVTLDEGPGGHAHQHDRGHRAVEGLGQASQALRV